MSDNPLAEVLAEFRKRQEAVFAGPPGRERPDLILAVNAARDDLPRLVLAAELVSATHHQMTVYGPVRDEEHPRACPHDPDSDWDEHFAADDGNWYCTSKPMGSECRCGEEWPCGEYAAVLGALTGRGTTTVRAELAEASRA